MAKAWRNESAAKINQARREGAKIATARVQKNERLYLEKVYKVKHTGNWLMSGLLNKFYMSLGWEVAGPMLANVKPVPLGALLNGTSVSESQAMAADEGFIAKFLRKTKAFFKGK